MNHSGDANKMVGEDHIPDATKMVSDTPRTNSCLTDILDTDGYVDQRNCPKLWVNHARELERELNAANQRIKRLEEALDTLTLVVGLTPIVGNKDALQEAMDMARAELKAKEAKP